MSGLLESKKTRAVLAALCIAMGILVAFGFGVLVGFRHAVFTSRVGENYYRVLYGAMPRGMPSGSAHGAVGAVLDVATATIMVQDLDSDEVLVSIVPGTVVREAGATISISAIHVGDHITVIGSPGENGEIDARFIRVLPATSTFPN